MEIFYSNDIAADICRLSADESNHAVKVLRHRVGDEISVIDGQGTMYHCVLLNDSPKCAEARVLESYCSWGSHPYDLTMAVCPTKNNDRYEWFSEKATEIGIDRIVPVIGEHSERRILKTDRIRKVVLSAAKQSLKAKLPVVEEALSVSDFIANADKDALRLIAYCFDSKAGKHSVRDELERYGGDKIIILIGPEGDFSKVEAEYAISEGFKPVSLGDSRLRTETAALVSVASVYFKYLK